MAKELSIAIQLANATQAKAFPALVKDLKNVNIQEWTANSAEHGPQAVKSIPDIILIDDNPENGEILSRIKLIKGNFPQSTIFFLSGNQDPQNIIAVMKAGAAEYLVEPINKDILINAIEEIRAKLTNAGKLAHGRIYSFISAKGGVGSTVLATNTAAALAMEKKNAVALLDMSYQSGDASVLLDIVPQNTILDICRNMPRLDIAFLRGVMSSHSTGVNFLSAPLNPEDSEEINGDQIAKILGLSKKMFDYVVLDCTSMHVDDCSVQGLKQSDKVLVVSDMSVTSIRNAVRLCKLIRKLGVSLERIEIIINRYIKGGALSLAEIEKNFDKPVYWLVPNDFSNIVSSINRGIPLVKMSQSASFSKNLVQLAKKLKGAIDDQSFRGIRGTFGKSI